MLKTLPSPVFTLKSNNYTPNCLKFHLDHQILYVGTQSGEILVWNLEVKFNDCLIIMYYKYTRNACAVYVMKYFYNDSFYVFMITFSFYSYCRIFEYDLHCFCHLFFSPIV